MRFDSVICGMMTRTFLFHFELLFQAALLSHIFNLFSRGKNVLVTIYKNKFLCEQFL
jgi:hypothetical protein